MKICRLINRLNKVQRQDFVSIGNDKIVNRIGPVINYNKVQTKYFLKLMLKFNVKNF